MKSAEILKFILHAASVTLLVITLISLFKGNKKIERIKQDMDQVIRNDSIQSIEENRYLDSLKIERGRFERTLLILREESDRQGQESERLNDLYDSAIQVFKNRPEF